MADLSTYRTTDHLRDGGELVIRSIRASDAPALRDAVERGDADTLFSRFQSARRHLSAHEIRYLTELDFDHHVGFVAEINGMAVGIARYVRTDTHTAEVAVVVDPGARDRGVATLLLTRLGEVAKANGIRTITGQVLANNQTMLDVIERMGFAFVCGIAHHGVLELRLPLDADSAGDHHEGDPA